MAQSAIKIPTSETRSFVLDAPIINESDRTLTFSFSSETPVERWWGTEILNHDAGSADLRKMKNAPFLWNHNPDVVLGVVMEATVKSDRRGYATIRWSNEEEAQKFRRQVEDGILSNISFAYGIDNAKEVGNKILVSRWTPHEISLVSVPADRTVGIGRSAHSPSYESIIIGERSEKYNVETTEINVDELRAEAIETERTRIATINALATRHGFPDLATKLIVDGKTIEEARAAFLDKIANASPQQPVAQPVNPLGLSDKEQKKYSIVRAVQAFIDKDWSKAGFERECSLEIEKRAGKSPQGFYVPVRDLKVQQRAPLSTLVPAQAGVLVETVLDTANFIDILRNKPLVMQMGAQMLSGLSGNVDIPRQTGTTTAYWVSEGVGPTETEPAFGIISLRPKTLGVLTAMTRLMMIQSSPDIEQLVRNDIASIIALEIDRAVLDGSGTAGQPRGILNTPGIGSVSLGTNGGAITYDALIDLETAVATANADIGNLAYMTNAKVVGALKKLKDTTNNYLWTASTVEGLTPGTPGSINGYPVGRTNQIPANKTKGTGTNLSCVVFGVWNQILVGEWGILDILPNPYGAGYAAGNVEIRALQTVDVQIRNPTSFAALTDVAAA
ncbi:MAG: phage major capsid protein [Xenococcaceae cyanobacterium]